ncbi:MAG: hypothetical protein LM587_01590 [Candidatus Aenigmarchaeota archaeon]|nr:hypothetical protein [Candidatus Aenigmarchaeota archaeon]
MKVDKGQDIKDILFLLFFYVILPFTISIIVYGWDISRAIGHVVLVLIMVSIFNLIKDVWK